MLAADLFYVPHEWGYRVKQVNYSRIQQYQPELYVISNMPVSVNV